MQNEERTEVIAWIEKMLFKSHEVASLMKDGKFIIAHEKLGGIIKNLSALGGKLQQLQKEPSTPSE